VTAGAEIPPGRLVFVDDLDAPVLAAEDRHHLERVLRLRPGSPLLLGDGHGGWRPARLDREVLPIGGIERDPPPPTAVTVGFAPVKGDRPEWVIQKLTELGVDHIRPFLSRRSVVRWDEPRARRQVERWRRVAREAAMQCRRTWLPTVHEVADVSEVAGLAGAHLADLTGEDLVPGITTVLVGPEGGWSDDERAACPQVRLSGHVLRAETAALVAAAYLTAHRVGFHG
jgi:16S rRNA (uracil1498-N3)-methyltransferase